MARRNRHLAWLALVGCAVVLCVLLLCGSTFPWPSHGGSDLCLGQDDGPNACDDTHGALQLWAGPGILALTLSSVHRFAFGPLPEGGPDPAMLAAAPGGLCLLL